MIEPILRGGMKRVSLRLQVHPKLERFRARVPYFLVTALITCLLLVPAVAIVLLAQLLGYRGTAEVSLTRTWLTIAVMPPGIAAVFALLTAVGRLSGYRPPRIVWNGLTPDAAADWSRRLAAAAERAGFVLVWRGRDLVEFVAVRDIAMEMNWTVHGGSKFPMRLSAQRTNDGLELKLANRTVVVWDTGERRACEHTAQAIVADAESQTTGESTSASLPASRS